MRILLATDAWAPQMNGVARTLGKVVDELRLAGDTVETVTPDRFRTMPLPSYPEIPLALVGARGVGRILDGFEPDAVHIATEGPIGLAARRACLRRGWPFTTGFHTRFPEYVKARIGLPLRAGYMAIRRFHAPSKAVMAPTRRVAQDLEARGLKNVKVWTRGVDASLFRPNGPEADVADMPRPIFLNVGRVAVEKNLPAFLSLELPGTKVVVGDGPARAQLEKRFPDARFVGAKFGEELAAWHRSADVFVFPSLTDTFGLVMLEALSSGVPVAAHPTMGPLDVLGDAPVGALDEDLRAAALRALEIPQAACVEYAATFSWPATAGQFRGWLAQIPGAIKSGVIAAPAA